MEKSLEIICSINMKWKSQTAWWRSRRWPQCRWSSCLVRYPWQWSACYVPAQNWLIGCILLYHIFFVFLSLPGLLFKSVPFICKPNKSRFLTSVADPDSVGLVSFCRIRIHNCCGSWFGRISIILPDPDPNCCGSWFGRISIILPDPDPQLLRILIRPD